MSKRSKNDRQRHRRKEKQRQTKQRQDSLRREQTRKKDEPRLRLVGRPSDAPPATLPPPSRMSMERTMREFHQALE